jgi:gamma-glutamylcyclotransferase (GGCT)/AIG2-like uncharacterized protein YtfP
MPSERVTDLFTYGSLMCEDIMRNVAGARLRCTPATLSGFRRFLVKDEAYPGVVPDHGGAVPGIVYHGIDSAGWQRLDLFEGTMYQRRPVAIRYEDGREAVVDCYLFRSEFAHRLTATEWNFAAFLQSGKAVFEDQYCGFKAID